jgi:hypothetical protein
MEATSVLNSERVWAHNQYLETKIGIPVERKLSLPIIDCCSILHLIRAYLFMFRPHGGEELILTSHRSHNVKDHLLLLLQAMASFTQVQPVSWEPVEPNTM